MKKISALIIVLFCGFLFLVCLKKDTTLQYEEPNWNHGYCELDGGRLDYISVSSRYHYKCEICGKDYSFNRVMSRK